MLCIEGSQGEGGGQVLRSALALSMCTQMPFRITNIRANRKKPGLMRQHLTAVRAAAEVCGAKVGGDDVGSMELTFEPGEVRAGSYEFAIGTAGSATLVLQTLLPALMLAREPSDLVLEGGTHNPFAPPFDFLAKAFGPVVRRMGVGLDLELERWGFYPAGGGRMRVHITPPSQLTGIDLLERGEIMRRSARAVVANLPDQVAKRELKIVRKRMGWDDDCLHIERVENSPGPGNVLMIELESEHIAKVFTAFGMHGVPAESVADRAVDELRRYLAADVPVGDHLADQLLVPLTLAAMQDNRSRFRTLPLSRHATTQVDLIRQFVEPPITIDHPADREIVVTVG